MPVQPTATFAVLLRQLRVGAGLTQEELATAAGLSSRSVSDLERGINLTARKETARLLAGALGLDGAARVLFEAAARGRVAAGETQRGAEIAAGVAAARTLPRDVVGFTGREPELRRVLAMAASAGAAGGVVSICAIGGMAGIGKTAFAVHAAHHMVSAFPDGQIFLALHAHAPGRQLVDPAEALASLLLTIGVSAEQIPPELQARASLWRDRLAGRRVLLVLDDAVGHEQVRPLLPGTAGSLVLVTSRRHLTALEGAHTISLDALSPAEAAELFVQLADRPALQPDDGPVSEITRLCGQLPLAIGMLARQLHHHPTWTVSRLAADLAAARDRLEFMHAENLSVTAAFDLSYADLGDDQKRVFRRLGSHPGTEIDAYVAAALDGSSLADARRNLEELYDHHLLIESARERYLFHDLIRVHAQTQATADPAAERLAALGRLLDYYVHAARAAERFLSRRSPGPHGEPAGDRLSSVPDLANLGAALGWLESEHLNMHAAATEAAEAAAQGQHRYAVALISSMHGFLRNRGYWDQALGLHRLALRAVTGVGDALGEAIMLTGLADFQGLTADYAGAATSLARALELFRGLGNSLGEASALNELGAVQQSLGDPSVAADSHSRSLDLYRSLGDRAGEASALNELGAVQRMMADYSAAADSHQQALAIFRNLDDRIGAASALNRLAFVQRIVGDYQAALANYEHALELHRDLGTRVGEASALNGLGHVRHAIGDSETAAVQLEQSISICLDLGYRFGEARALNDLGNLRRDAGDYPKALANHDRALRIYRDLGHRRGETETLSLRGLAQLAAGAHGPAAASFDQALSLARVLGERQTEAVTLSRRALALQAGGDIGQATADLAQALAASAGLKVLPVQAEICNAAGDLMLALGNLGEALPRYERAFTTAGRIGHLGELARALEGIGRCLLGTGEPTAGTARLRQALSVCERIGSSRATRLRQLLSE